MKTPTILNTDIQYKTMLEGWINYIEQLEKIGIAYLYHITDKDNLVSILDDGYLSSWGKIIEDDIKVSNPGGNPVTHRLDARISPDRQKYVHLYATAPTDAQLKHYSITHHSCESFVLKISLKALRPGSTVFWIGDPYQNGERIENVTDLVERLYQQPKLLNDISVDVFNAVRYNYILNAPKDVTSKITKFHPTAIIFVIDQSCSMARSTDIQQVEYDYISDMAAICVNNQIQRFLQRCITEDGSINHLYDIAVIGYGNEVSPAWDGDLSSSYFHSPEELLTYIPKEEDGFKWVRPKDSDTRGRCDLAFNLVYELLKEWVNREENHYSYPPTVIHISDGDVKREYQRDFLINAEKIKALRTTNNVIVWNFGILPGKHTELVFISGEEMPALMQFGGGLVLYEASSYLPKNFKEKAASIHRSDSTLERKTIGINVGLNTLSEVLQLCILPEE